MAESADVIVVGGGIVGLATAYALTAGTPALRPLVLEKEDAVGQHQTGHNSGVLHSGIYYKPGSLKALNCRAGKRAMEAFCAEHGIAYEICGKVIVAVSDAERPALQRIYERGQQNGVACELISAERLRDLEPHAAGVQAIHVPETGIVNFRRVCERLRDLIAERGGRVTCGAEVQTIERQGSEIIVGTREGTSFRARYLVNCGGLHCDRLAAAAQQSAPAKIVPFRGEYYELRPQARHLCRNLIYPVPDPNFPFLGVHFTRMIDGTVECGPNAVLAFAREGYRKTDIHFGDLWESLSYPGFQRLCRRYWRMGLGEMWRSFSKRAFVRALQRLIPAVRSDQLVAARAGVRAQAIAPDGSMVDDFLILEADRMIHVCNAPSPAATSALNIGKTVAEKLTAQLGTSPKPPV